MTDDRAMGFASGRCDDGDEAAAVEDADLGGSAAAERPVRGAAAEPGATVKRNDDMDGNADEDAAAAKEEAAPAAGEEKIGLAFVAARGVLPPFA